MTILIVGGACVVTVILLAVTWALCPQGEHHTSRPAHPGREAWARLRAARTGRSRPRATELHHEPDLSAEDTETLAWVRRLRPQHPRWAVMALQARIAALAVITSVSGRGTGPAGDGPMPGTASLEPGLESEGASRLTAPAPALLPIRGDAQGRDVQPRALDCCQAAGAMTGSLSPRPQEGARAASAPLPGPTPLPEVVADALAGLRATVAELAKPTDEERWPELARPWADDTGAFTAICGGV